MQGTKTERDFPKYKWSELYKDNFLANFTELLSENVDTIIRTIETDVNNAVKQIVNLYQKACLFMKKNNSCNFKIKQPAWWDEECKKLKSKKFKLLKVFRRFSTQENLRSYKESRKAFKELCRDKQQSWQKQCREDLINSRNDNNLFWKKIKSFRNKPKHEFDISDKQWFDHFKSLLYSEGVEKLNTKIHVQYDDESINDTFNRPFTEEELKASISALKNGKASGPDGIIAEMIKSTRVKISPILLLLYNKILSSGDFPNEWARSIICPIFKSGSLLDPGNFRGVSLIDIFNKILTGMMTNRLSKWAEDFSKIDEAQSGFRRGYSTIDNLFCLMATVQKYLSKQRGRFYCLFVDFSKAFDAISHEKLIKSLIQKGVGGNFLRLLVNMYDDLCSCVKTSEKEYTDDFNCNIGTRQGCKLSPILFSLYINSLVEQLRNEGVQGIQVLQDSDSLIALLYADDVINLADTVRNLQIQLDVLSRFCFLSGMKINLLKTKIIVFRNGGYLRWNERWYFEGKKIEVVSSYKYMGLMVTPRLIWTTAKTKLANQANKAIISMSKMQRFVGYFDYAEYFKLFDSMIKPILSYAAEIWGYEKSYIIEQVHNQYCRKFLKLPSNTANVFVRGECGRWPLYVDYLCKCVKYWSKLTRMNTYRYPYQCYRMLRNLDEVGRITWATHVRKLLYMHGFGYVWFYENVGDEVLFFKQLKQRLIDCSVQDWSSKLNDSEKAQHYRYIMPTFGLANYLKFDIPLKFRISLSKLRCSVHDLMVETGRHNEMNYETRICKLCSLSKVEDEFHFIMECPFYCNLRRKYLPTLMETTLTLEAFYNLFCMPKEVITDLSKFIHYAFKHRSEGIKSLAD